MVSAAVVQCLTEAGAAGDAVRSVAEVVYIPIYVEGSPEAGVQAVMEIMVSSSAWEAMVVANLISFVSSTLNDLKVSTLARW